MNLIDPALPIVRGLIDPQGRLVQADDRLSALNDRAGGVVGAPLAVPALARLARLAQRLGVLVSRAVVVAEGEDDIDMWVRAEPTVAGVRLAITGWRPRRPWEAAAAPERLVDFVAAEGSWRFATDASLRLTSVSADALARHGLDLKTLLGQPLTRLFRLEEDAHGAVPMLGALAMRERLVDQPAELRGTGVKLRISAAPRLDALSGFAGIEGAVSELAPPAAAPVTSAFAERLDAALRAPLGRIIAHADSIHAQAEGPLRQDYADYAADIASAGRHLLALVDDLVDLQAIERPDFRPAAEAIDLADVARRAAGLLQLRAAERRVRIDKPAADEALPATGEFRRALQIMVNLIGNAVRYSPADAMVWVRAEQEEGRALIVVADQGKGIAIEDQARIFEKFERVDKSEPGGSGLGLYIARRLARAMGGDLTVDSAPGQGARFSFWLPGR
ncbi:MAG: HAMP domain-containing histidine kinase [Sphingomonas sp.]|uniref:sensor histidine kinase n=1 Tax=Sphingomonas sp. TaxID=28214 RepID=UPI0025FC315B|nr:HAMP domain-containing sensor histidine kinase [Sphingomonas sp.]MBX9881621.1 HAMP domain-containing histidine kinase [Sphingomonas sp.]